jgi:hypothetical protein
MLRRIHSLILHDNGPDKKVFPHFYILGWYSTGSDAQESDMHIHKAVSSDIFLKALWFILAHTNKHVSKVFYMNIYIIIKYLASLKCLAVTVVFSIVYSFVFWQCSWQLGRSCFP